MAGYILVDVKTRKIIAICALVTTVLFAIGIIIGYFSGRGTRTTTTITSSPNVVDAIRSTCGKSIIASHPGNVYFDRYVQRHYEKTICVQDPKECWDFGLPRNYISYHLNGKSINIDGKLDDEAWTEVPWSEDFVDMRSTVYPKPYLDTKFKMRWDSERLYIGAYIEENDLWATHDTHDSPVWKENGFELLMDVDGSMFNYKQVQINVLGTMMDQLIYKSPWDAPDQSVKARAWHPDARKEVHIEGTINTPGDVDKYWSVEMSLSFVNLAEKSQRITPEPSEDEVWFLQFGRSEYNLTVVDGKYQKVPGSKPQWWSWGPCGAINLHLQDRWGLVQFKTNFKDKQFRFAKWHIYKSLFDMMDAMKQYKAINGKYTTSIEELDIPPYLLSRTCVDIPEITLTQRGNETVNNVTIEGVADFDVTVNSMFISHKPAHIRSDRYVTFR